MASAVIALETGLKNVENFWAVGSQLEGDGLLESIVDAGIGAFVANGTGFPIELKQARFLALQELLSFLEKHRRRAELRRVLESVGRNTDNFDPDQLLLLKHFADLVLESAAAREAKSDLRLIYFACQNCGGLNLVCTAPCVHCGFAATTERDLRRSILLSSHVLATPSLLDLASAIDTGRSSSSRAPTFEQLWPSDLDTDARTHTTRFNSEIPALLAACQRNAAACAPPPPLTVKCSRCQKSYGIFVHQSVQRCLNCSAEMVVPRLRRLKATLKHNLWWTAKFAERRNDVAYANFIASYVLITDYALRRDQAPTYAQGQDLIERFASLGSLSFNNGNYAVKVENGQLVGTVLPACQADEELIDYFHEYVDATNNLFMMMTSRELAAAS